MSDPTAPITPARFAAALKDLSLSMLHLKILELRNSIAHLDYSNEQLKEFASATPPDQDCVDAIRENELVIGRMQERISLVRAEVEQRGASWTEFQSKEEVDAAAAAEERRRQRAGEAGSLPNGVAGGDDNTHVNGDGHGGVNGEVPNGNDDAGAARNPWTDGTFQTGTIRTGEVRMDPVPERTQGGSLTDEELRRRMEEQMRRLANYDEDVEEEGMHL